MQDEQFDDLIRQKLNSEEESVSAGLWSRVEAELPAAKQRVFKRNLLWLLLLLLIPSGIGWYYFTSNQTEISSLNGNQSDKTRVNVKKSSELNNADSKSEQFNSIKAANNDAAGNSIRNHSVKNNNSTVLINNNTVPKTIEPLRLIASTTDVNPKVNNSEWDLLNPKQATISEPEISQALITHKPASEIKKTKKGIRVFADIYYAPEFTQHTRDLGSGNSAYLKLRRNTEKNIYSHSQGIRAGFWLNTNFFFKTGIDIFDMNERLSYTFIPGMGNLPIGMRIDSVNGYFINPITNALVADTIVGSVDGNSDVTIANHFRFVNVPLLLGWHVQHGMWNLHGSAGLYMNIYSGYKGKIIHQNMQSLIDISSSASPYKQNIGLGLSAEVLASYKIHKNTELMVGPKYQYHLSDISRKGALIKERLSSLGVYTGIRVNF